MSPRYEVRLHRIGRWWAVDVPQLALHTQCRTLEEAEGLARGLVAEAVGSPPEAVALSMVVPQLAPLLGSVAEARQRRVAAVAAEQETIAVAVQALVDELNVSQADACRLLGMSPDELSRFTPPRGSTAGRTVQLPAQPAPATPRPTGAPGPRSRPGPGTPDGGPAAARRRRLPTSPPRPTWAMPPDGAGEGGPVGSPPR